MSENEKFKGIIEKLSQCISLMNENRALFQLSVQLQDILDGLQRCQDKLEVTSNLIDHNKSMKKILKQKIKKEIIDLNVENIQQNKLHNVLEEYDDARNNYKDELKEIVEKIDE